MLRHDPMQINSTAYWQFYERSRSRPGMLWHYTDIEGLRGILGSATLRASSAAHMNDLKEMRIGPAEISRIVIGKGHRGIEEYWNRFTSEQMVANTCIACLSGEFDDLSQWRGYAAGRQGFALGFNYADLEALAERHQFCLVRCIYERGELVARLERMAEEMTEYERVLEMPDGDPNRPLGWPPAPQTARGYAYANWDWWKQLRSIAPQFKHHAFHNEHEYRLVVPYDALDGMTVKTRLKNGEECRYIEFPLEVVRSHGGGDPPLPAPLIAVLMGPVPRGVSEKDTFNEIDALVRQSKIGSGVFVTSSDIPFDYEPER